MLLSRKHLLTSFALLGVSAFAFLPGFAGASSAIPAAQSGSSAGSLHGPSFSSIGKVLGRLRDASGALYECDGTLSPNNDSGASWQGYSPTGTISGQLTPVTGGAQADLTFWGAYAIDSEGSGSFQAYLTAPNDVPGGARELVGSFAGRFDDAAEIDPQTLLPDPGQFIGLWDLD